MIARHLLRQAGTRGTEDALSMLRRHPWTGNVRELRHAVDRAIIVAGGGDVGASHVQSVLGSPANTQSSRETEEETEHRLRAVLERHAWNTQRAAEELHIHRATLYRRMHRMGLSAPLATPIRMELPPVEQGLRIIRS
jgi:transcriptional regulator of acetoin/glycerol metabolism